MKTKPFLSRKLQLALVSAILTLIIVGFASYRGMTVSRQSDQWVRHTHVVLEELQDLLFAVQNIESSYRGFVLTGNDSYVESFSSNASSAQQDVTAVRNLTLDNPEQQRHIPRLESLTTQEIEFGRPVISLRKHRGMETAAAAIRNGPGEQITEEFQAVVHDMQIEELRLLAIRDADAQHRLLETKIILILSSLLGVLIAVGAGWCAQRDSSKRGQAEEALFSEKERAQVTLTCIGDGVICTDANGSITFVNPVAEIMMGSSRQESTGHSLPEIFRIMDPACREIISDPMLMLVEPLRAVRSPLNFILIGSGGIEVPIEISVAPIHDRDGNATGSVIVFRDVSAARALALEMIHSAEHDSLTGLPNRMLLNERVGLAIVLANRHMKKVAVLFLDLDGFKHINDSLGHPTGDKLLQSVGKCLVECVRASDTVSRQGGDEFVVLLTEVEHAEDAALSARRMLHAVAQTHSVNRRDLHITVSIGISIYPDDGLNAETLIKNADTALYQAKENGRQSFQFFKPGMHVRAVERQSIEESLRHSLARGEFILHYQPIVNLKSGEITGAEALIRWSDPVRGLVSPAQFIPVAEDSGLILPIGKWVLREACQQAKAWQDAGLPLASISVNVSAIQFRNEHFLETVFATLQETGLDPKSLELELTESVLIKRADSAASVLETLRASGIRIAIDDFGTGYSSLSYLTKFPVDALKIDQSFIRQITGAARDTAIVAAVISMGRSLKLRIVAEGVETREELEFLLAHNCEEAQGYFFSKPVHPREFARLLETAIPQASLG